MNILLIRNSILMKRYPFFVSLIVLKLFLSAAFLILKSYSGQSESQSKIVSGFLNFGSCNRIADNTDLNSQILTDTEKHPYASLSPITVPRKFPVPGMDNSWHITFEPDGRTFYFVTIDYVKKMEVVKYSRFQNGEWSLPELAEFSGKHRIETPHVSPDGSKFFFTYAVPGQENIYVMNKTSSGWSEPRDLGSPVNSSGFEGCPSTALNGNLYFFSSRNGSFRVYRSKFVDGSYTEPEELDRNINRDGIGEFYIAPDESYLLFDISTPPDSCQLHISFNRNGSWSVPQNLGKRINISNFQKRPCVSPDGKYLFYTGKGGEYQVDFKPLLDSIINVSSPGMR